MTQDEIAARVKDFVLEEFLPDDDPEDLTYTTELVTSGVLDSLAVLTLASFIEDEWGIEVSAKEARAGHLNTVSDIAKLVTSRLES